MSSNSPVKLLAFCGLQFVIAIPVYIVLGILLTPMLTGQQSELLSALLGFSISFLLTLVLFHRQFTREHLSFLRRWLPAIYVGTQFLQFLMEPNIIALVILFVYPMISWLALTVVIRRVGDS